MNMKYITSGLFAAMIVSSTAFLTSCADDLEVGKNIDESAYSGIYENNAYLRDGKSNLVSKVVELHGETYATTVKMGLSKTPNTATSAKVKIDAAYLETIIRRIIQILHCIRRTWLPLLTKEYLQ